MNKLSVSWNRYQELMAVGRVSGLVYKDDKGLLWSLHIEHPVFAPQTKPDEQKIAALMNLIEQQRAQ